MNQNLVFGHYFANFIWVLRFHSNFDVVENKLCYFFPLIKLSVLLYRKYSKENIMKFYLCPNKTISSS
jgi:hypothetical protein